MQASIHLNFNGTCEDAFNFYADVLGAKIEYLLRYGESGAATHAPAVMQNKVVHGRLRVGDMVIAGADIEDARNMQGFQIILELTDEVRARDVFSRLTEGGQVEMALQKTFWSDCYGTLVDQWGVPWEFNVVADTSV